MKGRLHRTARESRCEKIGGNLLVLFFLQQPNCVTSPPTSSASSAVVVAIFCQLLFTPLAYISSALTKIMPRAFASSSLCVCVFSCFASPPQHACYLPSPFTFECHSDLKVKRILIIDKGPNEYSCKPESHIWATIHSTRSGSGCDSRKVCRGSRALGSSSSKAV